MLQSNVSTTETPKHSSVELWAVLRMDSPSPPLSEPALKSEVCTPLSLLTRLANFASLGLVPEFFFLLRSQEFNFTPFPKARNSSGYEDNTAGLCLTTIDWWQLPWQWAKRKKKKKKRRGWERGITWIPECWLSNFWKNVNILPPFSKPLPLPHFLTLYLLLLKAQELLNRFESLSSISLALNQK